ncbi:unnamed protein product [Brachionus calyciflorus]|uniref:CCDC66 domain-containing protein n=1 Tax=Brachionus calyciflorus TaxID=104777 RepID=A0A813PFN7_9BILA|nr:unnamed protein product [Brachionus calyciflorus]
MMLVIKDMHLIKFNPEIEYSRQQLDNYLRLPNNSIEQYGRQPEPYVPLEQNQPPQQVQYTQRQVQPQPPPPPVQQRTQKSPNYQNNKNGTSNNQEKDFFQSFGKKYDAQKNKLKNELQNDYAEYMQQKAQKEAKQRSKNQPVSDEFYATLPLQGLGASKENNIRRRTTDFNVIRDISDNNSKRGSNEWWKDKKEPEIKPYSKYAGSSENISNLNTPFASDLKAKSQSQFDVNADRQYQQPQQTFQNDPYGYDPNIYRARSANSYENLNPYPPIDPYRQQYQPAPQPLIPVIDPSLTDILRRPPVGLKSAIGIPQTSARVQFNDNVQYNDFQPNQYNYQEQPRNQGFQQNTNRYTTQQNPVLSNRPTDNNPFNFTENQNTKDAKAIKAREYQEELERQVREKQLKKQKEKEEQEKLDKKMLIETAIYNPYGRSGGGAPIKDKDGNTVANLSQVKSDPLQYSPRDIPPPQSLINNLVNNSSRANSSDFLNSLQPNSGRKSGSNDDQTFARGGNGIFGEGKSDDQKKKEERYKQELQQQIEERQRQKALEKERQRIEDEKEQKRIEEEQRKIKAELEEEERKKKQKEENEKNQAENAKRLADENRKQAATNKRVPNKPVNKRVQRKPSNNDDIPIDIPPPVIQTDFRSNSPPVPAAAKKLNGGKAPQKNNNNFNNNNVQNDQNDEPPARNFSPPPPKPIAQNRNNKPKSNATADYYITESRLNVASPTANNNKKFNASNLATLDDTEERVPSVLVNDYQNDKFKENTKKSKFTNNKNNKLGSKEKNSENIIPTKPVLRKISRPPSQVSNSEVLAQLNNLKKHLQNELNDVEKKVNNSSGRTSVGQLIDMRDNILNVRTPSGDNRNGFKTYRKDIETPPLRGGLEPKTYFRENTIKLDSVYNNDDIFSNDLQQEANERQRNRLNSLIYQDDPFLNDKLTAQNQLRLKKLRDMEDDSLSLNDPNDVLNKFINRNNRQASAVTIQDDAWLRQTP